MEGRNELGEEDGEERQPGDLRAAKPALCPEGTLEPHGCPSPSSWSEIHGVWLQQLPGLPAQVPRAPEGVKRGEEKQRKKNKSVGREQLGQGLFALAWMCPRCVYSYCKSGFARRRARLLSTHTQPHPKCLGDPSEQQWLVAQPWPQGPPEPRQAVGLLSCLAWTGRALSLGLRWERTSCPKATSLLCCWGQGLGMGMCWDLAAFLVWKENTPFPGMLFVSHGQTRALPVGLRGAKPCTCVHSVTVLLECPLSWQFPGCVHPSLLPVPILPPQDQSWGPRHWPGLQF